MSYYLLLVIPTKQKECVVEAYGLASTVFAVVSACSNNIPKGVSFGDMLIVERGTLKTSNEVGRR